MSQESFSKGGPAGSSGAGGGVGASEHIFVRTGVMAAQLVDTAKFPAQYQYTVTGRMRKRGTHGQLGTLVSINGKNVTLFRHRHLLYAVADRCSHQGGSLCLVRRCRAPIPRFPHAHWGDIEEIDGRVCVACPRHGYDFDLLTGQSVHPEGYEQEVFPLRVESNGEVSVGFRGLDSSVFMGEEDF